MQFFAAAASVVGNVRGNNEDNFSLDGFHLQQVHGNTALITEVMAGDTAHLAGVYDGMGGYRGGETASWIMASAAARWLDRLRTTPDPGGTLAELCLDANESVCAAADGSNMGTTCALLCVTDDTYAVCNVGDSPVFLLRDGIFRQLSVDHNQKALIESITGRPAAPGQKFKLTQCIGIPKEEMQIQPHLCRGKPAAGDRFLLCSDGLTDMLDSNTISRILAEAATMEAAAAALVERALAAGGIDNITVICLEAISA